MDTTATEISVIEATFSAYPFFSVHVVPTKLSPPLQNSKVMISLLSLGR
jgi:hypothetical protein